ncbi:sugar ABC transporter permease [Hydrogenoanaerobacterium sp.]|uniref:carbohydrate ABC transporter permease n=1 Tax=Hydrogenoanaerobacterium sp. TaxID=2953763 RepID=UPI0028966BB6|nr:sugar ABC transporter permease [Hydrogenoanaerobacterium sp.]
MKKNMTLKQFLFILPLLILIAVFSLYPIFSSFLYTLFDYRTNDQQYNKLFLHSSFNAGLFYEDCDYINYFLLDDITLVKQEDAAEFNAVSAEISAVMTQLEPLKDASGAQKVSAKQAQELSDFIDRIGSKLQTVYNRYPNTVFYNQEKVFTILDEMETCFVQPNFIGMNGYQKLLGDHRFFTALGNTMLFTVVSVTVELVLGMALALIMNKAIRGIGLVRTTALIPWAIPTAVSALIWSYLYDGSSGVVAQLFYKIGLIGAPEQMLLSAGGAMTAAIIADIWKTTPYMALLLLAGLQMIDRGLYESAAIDGSGKVHTFFTITLPMMKSSILVALLFRTLDAFRVYDLIAILTGGGPGGATETLSVYAYKAMISQSNYGYGAVIVVAMFLCVAAIAVLFVKVLGAEVIKED